MNHHRKIAKVVGGLTVFTAALFAQNTPASTSAATSSAVNSAVTNPVTPPSTPVVPQVGSPAATGAASSTTTATSATTAGPRIDNSPKPRSDTSVNTGASTNGVLNANRSSPSTSGKVGSDAAANSAVRPSPSTFMALDTNGDGRVSSMEYSASLARRVDANGNPVVSTDANASANAQAEKRGFWSRMFHRDSQAGATTSTGVQASSNPSFAQLDTNGDGYLSSDEVEASRGHDRR